MAHGEKGCIYRKESEVDLGKVLLNGHESYPRYQSNTQRLFDGTDWEFQFEIPGRKLN